MGVSEKFPLPSVTATGVTFVRAEQFSGFDADPRSACSSRDGWHPGCPATPVTIGTMPKVREMVQSRVMAADPYPTFRRTLPLPLPTLFSSWYGPIAPIKQVLDQHGEWAAVGQTRTVVQVGAGTMREELTHVDPPRSFGYTLTGITGPFAPLVGRVEGEWRFAPAGTGTEVSWRWVVHPKSALASAAMPVFELLWRGYARQALQKLSDELLR